MDCPVSFDSDCPKPVRDDLEFLRSLIEQGHLRPVVGRTFALRDIVEAHRHADTDHKVGDLVILVG